MTSELSFRIRQAVAADAEFIKTCQLRMAQETEGLALADEVVDLGVKAVIHDPTKGKYFIAEDDTSKCLACLLTIPEWSDWRNGTVIWIHSLYVLPAYRKLGVFKAMFMHLKNLVDQSPDFRGLRLYVDKRNELAKKAYLQAGMSAEHYELFEWLK
jgi:GNAT superfamily N-acetyltransferase